MGTPEEISDESFSDIITWVFAFVVEMRIGSFYFVLFIFFFFIYLFYLFYFLFFLYTYISLLSFLLVFYYIFNDERKFYGN